MIDSVLWYGDFASSGQVALRTVYGILLLAQLILTLPQWRRFFTSEKYGGYVEASAWADRVHSPPVVAVGITIWVLAALCLIFDCSTLLAAGVSVALGRYLFVAMRWRSILRGMGAPGHMNMWIGGVVFLLELSRIIDRDGLLRATVVSAARIDFALIIISAGVYKIFAGYARNDGFQRGLVNPWWGFFSVRMRTLREDHIVFRLLNHLGYLSEIVGGLFFLIPGPSVYAAFAFGASFLVLGALIRLGFLAEMVAACALLYVRSGDPFATGLAVLFGNEPMHGSDPTHGFITAALAIAVAIYAASLPLAYAGMSWNFYRRKRLPEPLQRVLDVWVSLWGLILWRVFTRDLVEFHVGISYLGADGTTQPYWDMRPFDRRTGFRYMHVGEFICLASIFTTLKYYPTNGYLFETRLLRYARTIPTEPNQTLVFDYFFIVRRDGYFRDVHAARFLVNPATGTITEKTIDPAYDIRAVASGSPVRPGTRPGTYAPAK